MLNLMTLFLKDPMITLVFTGLVSSLYSFCSQRKHLIVTLLSLEGAVLSIFLLISIYTSELGTSFNFVMVFISLSVCEAALGLTILITIVRSHSNDFITSFSVI